MSCELEQAEYKLCEAKNDVKYWTKEIEKLSNVDFQEGDLFKGKNDKNIRMAVRIGDNWFLIHIMNSCRYKASIGNDIFFSCRKFAEEGQWEYIGNLNDENCDYEFNMKKSYGE